ncbi:MAG TPA: hypothetical protein PKX74_18325, partial [Leptospiraceae bacterium]|nr:hypothetical protein [Leptospiraceae bacterium]
MRGVNFDIGRRGHSANCSSANVETRTMSWANHFFAFNLAVIERIIVMRTHILKGTYFIANT